MFETKNHAELFRKRSRAFRKIMPNFFSDVRELFFCKPLKPFEKVGKPYVKDEDERGKNVLTKIQTVAN